jgi:glutamyl-tRNA synthetase
MSNQPIRVRFAPSPTGPLHIGGVRTALYNYLFARKHGGRFILRIEDTDSTRFVPGAEEYIIEAFRWLGLTFDEGVDTGGDYAPYRQSERKTIYKQYADQLITDGKAYTAFDTPAELEAKRQAVANFQYDAGTRMEMCNSLTLSAEEVQQRINVSEHYVVRLLVQPNEEVKVHDLIRGEITVNSSVLDDKVLYKSADQLPTYHLANIVDDHLMAISHVIRGEEWLPSAPLHVLLYRALGWADTMPVFAHLPLLLKPDGKGKLSKRDGDRLGFPVFPLEWHDPKSGETSTGFREKGYLPQALLNFLALLGWNPGDEREVMTMEELIEAFDLAKCNRSGAKFDFQKGIWFNHEYILHMDNATAARLFAPILEADGIHAPLERVEQVVGLMKGRVNFIHELWPLCRFFFQAPTHYDEKTRQKRWKPQSPVQIAELKELLASLEDFSIPAQEAAVMAWITEKGYGTGDVMNACRLALVGEGIGPGIFDLTAFLGKEETLRRLDAALSQLTL